MYSSTCMGNENISNGYSGAVSTRDVESSISKALFHSRFQIFVAASSRCSAYLSPIESLMEYLPEWGPYRCPAHRGPFNSGRRTSICTVITSKNPAEILHHDDNHILKCDARTQVVITLFLRWSDVIQQVLTTTFDRPAVCSSKVRREQHHKLRGKKKLHVPPFLFQPPQFPAIHPSHTSR